MKEIECRFLEVDKESLIGRLISLGAEDRGETLLEETIIYNSDGSWKDQNRLIRLRKSGDKMTLAYKEHREHAIDGAHEIEIGIDDVDKTALLLESIGFPPYRRQQKKRHTFRLDGSTIDIDTWPGIPAYAELEGDSEESLKKLAGKLGFDWKDAVFNNAAWVIEEKYGIPVRKMRWFTFDRQE